MSTGMRGRLAGLVAVAVVALVAAALAGAAGGKTHAAQAREAAPTGVTVFAGPNLRAPPPGVSKQADALAFFPSAVTVHEGDTVTWQFRGFHTVTFPGLKRPYPFIVESGRQSLARDAAGQPLWWAGKAPQLTISPLTVLQQGGATLSSQRDLRNSGLLRILQAPRSLAPKPYTLTFLKPGVYRYVCAIHPYMRGVVRVLPRSGSAPSAAAEEATAKTQLASTIADLKRLATRKPAAPRTVWVGIGDRRTGAEITSFFPKVLSVKTGDTVTFVSGDPVDIHTVTFGPEAFRSTIEKTFVAPAGGRVVLNPLGALPSEPPGPPRPISYDGSNHGNGYLNSGIIPPKGSPQPGTRVFRVTFTKPGTYRFECVIHANMDGTIVVR